MRYPKVVFSVILLAVCVLMWLRNRIGRKAPRVGDTYCRLQKNAMRGVPYGHRLVGVSWSLAKRGVAISSGPHALDFLVF
jgi:hypothetical protein